MRNVAAEYASAAAQSPCTACYLSVDQLGSTRAMTDGTTGAVVERYDFAPYGEDLFAGTGRRTKALKYQSATDRQDMTHRFTGKERDPETAGSAMPSGLDYFGARYLSGAMGRFTSPDQPLIDQNPPDPQSWNLIATVNNPLINIDPAGRCSQGADGRMRDDSDGKCADVTSVTVTGTAPEVRDLQAEAQAETAEPASPGRPAAPSLTASRRRPHVRRGNRPRPG